jgi:hypothetical protein
MIKDSLRPKMPDSGRNPEDKNAKIARIRDEIKWHTSVARSHHLHESAETSRQIRKSVLPSLHKLAKELEVLTGERHIIDVPEARKITSPEDEPDSVKPKNREHKMK